MSALPRYSSCRRGELLKGPRAIQPGIKLPHYEHDLASYLSEFDAISLKRRCMARVCAIALPDDFIRLLFRSATAAAICASVSQVAITLFPEQNESAWDC